LTIGAGPFACFVFEVWDFSYGSVPVEMYADYFRIFVAFEETFQILEYEILIRLGIPFLLQAEAFD
jgi:hypothetical protein